MTGRVFGGCGLSLDAMPAVVACETSDLEAVAVVGPDEARDAEADVAAAVTRLLRANSRPGGLEIRIESIPPRHIGLGTKTAVVLAALIATSRALGLALSKGELQRLSGRGGASGVGVHGFFNGGFIVDGGHPRRHPLMPSSAAAGFVPPPALVRLRVPAKWRIWLLVPRSGVRYFGDREIDVFRANLPIPPDEAIYAVALAYHGIAASIATRDLGALRLGLEASAQIGFKRREIEAQTPDVAATLAGLGAIGLAHGMSSLGPLVFAIGLDDDEARVERVAADAGAVILTTCNARNRGYEVVE